MPYRYMPLKFAAIALGLALAVAVPAADARADADRAAEILERVSEHYKSLDAVAFSLQVYSLQRAEGFEDQRDMRLGVALRKPNHLAIDGHDAAGANADPDRKDILVRSNGEELTIYLAQHNRYFSNPAPADFDALVTGETLRQATAGAIDLAVAPLRESPLEELLAEASAARYVGERELDGRTHEVIRLDMPQQLALEVLVTTGDEPRLRQIEVDFTAAIEQAAAQGQTLEAEAYIRFTDWRAVPQLDDETFRFNPPAEAEPVQ